MKVLYVLSSLFLVASSANLGRLYGCPPYYIPVCASNYETYPNECEMQCDPVHPNLFKLYNGPCIMADSSAEARDHFATRHGSQFNIEDFAKATTMARETEDNVNSYYGAVLNLIRLRHGNNGVFSLKDRLAPKLHIQREGRKAKSKFAAIQDSKHRILEREANRYGKKQQNKDLIDQNSHRPLYSSEMINPDSESNSRTSNLYDHQQQYQNMYHQNLNNYHVDAQSVEKYDHLEDYDNEVNNQAVTSEHIARQAEEQALRVEIDAQLVYDRAGRTKCKVLKAKADVKKSQDEARQAEKKMHSLLESNDKKDLETRIFQIQAQAHEVEHNARNALKEARVVQVEAREVREKAREAAKYASEAKTVLQSRKASQHIKQAHKVLNIAQRAQKNAHRAEKKARKAEERARNIEIQALQIVHQHTSSP